MAAQWTEEAAELVALAKQADAIEVAGCTEEGGEVSRVESADEATFFSVYFHFTPEWPEDPNGLRGAMCVADRDALSDALTFANELGQRHGLPIHDFT